MNGKEFRGEAGDIVEGFVSPATCLTAIPVGACAVLLAVLASFVEGRMQLPPWVAVPITLALLAPLTGLFAMAARAGKANAGFLDALSGPGAPHVLGFVLRYAILQTAWCVPMVLLIQKAAPWMLAAFMSGPGTRMTLAIWSVVALACTAIILPVLCLLVATKADSVGECFSADAWRWVLSERRADLVALVSSALGGMMLFALCAIPPLAFLIPWVADMSPQNATMLPAMLVVVPWATSPILVGRLAGAFVGCEPTAAPQPRGEAPPASKGPSTFDVPVPQASRTMAGLAGIPVGVSPMRMDCPTNVQLAKVGGAQGVPLGVAIARAHQLAETDMDGCLAELEALRQANPRNPAVVAELARALRKANRNEEAIAAAAQAIRLALSGGAGPIAHDVFRSFAHDAAALNLEPAVYEQLARILCARREYDGAGWCYRAAAALGGDPRALQKGMLGVADSAVQAGAFDKGVSVYEAFLATWPDSPLARFAKDGAEQSRRRITATSSAK